MVRPALSEFIEWLPGELTYSTVKAPYAAKLERAKKPIDDPASIVGFLGAEWHHAQLLRDQGVHHAPEHQKTAQLQFAKFAAGIFDKYALIDWIQLGSRQDPESMQRSADIAAAQSLARLRHPGSFAPGVVENTDHRQPFEFIFKTELADLQDRIVFISEHNTSLDTFRETKRQALTLGMRATAAYLNYAEEHLTADQYFLAPSQLVE